MEANDIFAIFLRCLDIFQSNNSNAMMQKNSQTNLDKLRPTALVKTARENRAASIQSTSNFTAKVRDSSQQFLENQDVFAVLIIKAFEVKTLQFRLSDWLIS